MTPDQERLLGSLAAGELAAFGPLVGPYERELERSARRILRGDPGLAEEVTQEALLNAFRSLRGGARPENLRAWLHTIVRNCALNALRAGRSEQPFDERERPTPAAATSALVEQQEWMDWLMAAIAALPPRQRDALVAQAFEGRSQLEIADAMGTSVPAVKTLLHRARRTLTAAQPSSLGASVPVLIARARGSIARVKSFLALKAGANGAASGWQVLAAVTVASGVLVATHGATAPAPAGGQPARPGVPVATLAARRPASAAPARTPPGRETPAKVHREGARATRECLTGRRLSRTLSRADLLYASHHLSTSAREYTECEALLASGAGRLGSSRHPRRAIYFAQSPRGVTSAGAGRERFAIEPSEVLVFPHQAWSIVGIRWKGWGTGRARGSGTSLERTCEPDCRAAAGMSYLRSTARIVLWKPGRFEGRDVYRCFRLEASGTVPSAMRGCF